MNIIIVKTQKELDALPDSFEEYTEIHVKSRKDVWIKVDKARDSSHVVAGDSSHVVALGSSHVVARDSSHVEARDSSHVEALGSAHVVAWDLSYVEARDSSHVEARDSSHVEALGSSHVVALGSAHVEALDSSHVVARDLSYVVALGSSHVEAWGSSHVEAWGSAHVVALGSAHVVALGSAHVVAWGNCSVKVQQSSDVEIRLKQYAICNSIGCDPKLTEQDDTAHHIKTPVVLNTLESFLEIYTDNMQPDGRILLYKMTRHDGTDHHSGTIKYEGVVDCPDWDPNPSIQCGNGLHLSPTIGMAKMYNSSGMLKKCLVKLEDIAVYGPDITKVRCRQVEVLEERINQ